MCAAMLSIPFRTGSLNASVGPDRPERNRAAADWSMQSDRQVSASAANSTTDAEIAQLVSCALENALMALGAADRDTFINLRAYEMRMGMREVFESLPQSEATDPTVARDYRRSIVFQNVALDLAINIADAIERYAKARDQEAPCGEPELRSAPLRRQLKV